MTEGLLIAIIAGVLAIIGANAISKRIGVAGPLILVTVGVAVSYIPAVSAISVPPELILAGVLPPLLYSAAVSAPAIEFRRDFAAISGLSVLLVIVSSLVLGAFFVWAIPGLGFPLSVALGAILSPTDAVATKIVSNLGAPRRIVTMLEGESLINDASALVLLRTGIVAASAGFSLVTTIGAFVWSVFCAVIVGALAGALALRLRAWLPNPAANTALSLTVPFLAYIPADALGGSGLVSAVVAGLVCGQGALRWLTPEQRVSDKMNWQTIEFLLEGAVFLIMGLELFGIIQNNLVADEGLWAGVRIASIAFLLIILVRALYVLPMMRIHAWRVKRTVQSRLAARTRPPAVAGQDVHRTYAALAALPEVLSGASRRHNPKMMGRIRADIDYFDASPLTWKHNTVIIWAGMRGAVTLAAAQTLPRDTPEWDLLVFIAFLVAISSLLIQGLTLPRLVRALGLGSTGGANSRNKEVRHINRALRDAAESAVKNGAVRRGLRSALTSGAASEASEHSERQTRIEKLELEFALVLIMRTQLHVLGRSGRYSTTALRYVMDELDAREISLSLNLDIEK